MTLTTRIMIWFGVIITLGLLSVIVYQQVQINKQQNAIQTQITAQKELIDGVMRAQSSWATKDDVKALLNSNGVNSQALAAIQKDMSDVKATLTAANTVTVVSTPQHGTNLPSTSTGPSTPTKPPVTINCPSGGTVTCPNTDPFGYQVTPQNFALNEEFGTLKVPFGSVTFDASKKDAWSQDIPQREYHVANVVGTDENQKLTVYNKVSIKVDNKAYDIPIANATTETIYPKAKFSWLNPRLYAGADMGVDVTHIQGTFTPDLNLQIMSYGKYKNQPDFSILQLGGGYNTVNRTPELVVTPFSYNIGQHIPLMNNLYLGPSVGVGTDGNFTVGLGLKVGL